MATATLTKAGVYQYGLDHKFHRGERVRVSDALAAHLEGTGYFEIAYDDDAAPRKRGGVTVRKAVAEPADEAVEIA